MMSNGLKLLIAGAGLGGLAAAIACAQRGWAVSVFEQAPQLGEIGAGIQVSPSGLRVLRALGVEEAVLAASCDPVGRQLLAWNTGYSASTLFRREDIVERYGLPQVSVHRADLHAILVSRLQALQPDALHVNTKIAGFEQDETVRVKTTDGRMYEGDALIGSDGLHSVVRSQLFGASRPSFTGGVAWRGVIPISRLPQDARTQNRQVWLGVNGHFVVYPIRRGEMINVVGHVEREDWQVESWNEIGTTSEMQEDFSGWHPTIQSLITNIEKPYKWALFLHPTMEKWSSGRVTLLGDACHPTLPYLGFGATMAFEDGIVLARCLERGPTVQAGLELYEQLRIPRTTRIVNESAGNLSRWHNVVLADPDLGREYIDREALNQRDSRDWLNTYDATTTPLTS